MTSRPARDGELSSPYEMQCIGVYGCYERIPPGHIHECPKRGLARLWAWLSGCDHDWEYDAEESAGPWTGYIERCTKCGALQQVPA